MCYDGEACETFSHKYVNCHVQMAISKSTRLLSFYASPHSCDHQLVPRAQQQQIDELKTLMHWKCAKNRTTFVHSFTQKNPFKA